MLLAPLIAKQVENEMAQEAGNPGKTDLEIEFKGKSKTTGATDGGKAGKEAMLGAGADSGAGGQGAGQRPGR